MKCPHCHSDNPDTSRFCGRCAAPLPHNEPSPPQTETFVTPVQDLSMGSTFAGRYQIIEELGRGGMGRVYKVFDAKVKEKIALKLIKPELAMDQDMVGRLNNELKLARKIRHKNVCAMFDVGEAGGVPFLTMEYIHGEDLKSMIRMSSGLSFGSVLSYGKQICEGLSEAHSLGIIHRDLKPQNIMIDKGGNAKIMDFGIARSLWDKETTGAGVVVGSPEYMSPEQAESKDVDQASDIYSLGIILYELATGRVPFKGDTALSILLKHQKEVPKDPREYNPRISDDLSRLILRCLEKDKARRYSSAQELYSALERIEKGLQTSERFVPKQTPSTSQEIILKPHRKKLLIPALLLAALMVTVALFLWRFILARGTQPVQSSRHSIAVFPFDDLSPKKDYEYLCEGIPDTLINALTKVKGLRVPARTSAFSFRGKNLEIKDIARTLNVETVLRGSVQVIGDRLRVTPQLIEAKSGSYLWSNRFDRKLEDVFAIQDEIAQEVIKALKIKLLGNEGRSLIKNYTSNLEAYTLYMQGRYFWNKRTTKDIKEAVDYFSRAVEKDSGYAPAYVGLADCDLMLPLYGNLPAKEFTLRAKAAISNALEIDEQLPEAYASLAKIKEWSEWDWKGAEQDYRRSIELNPKYATAHHWYAISLTIMGRFAEAMAETKLAIEIDPLSLIIKSTLGDVFYFKGDYDRAIEQYRGALELDKNFAEAHHWLAKCYRQKGMLGEAVSELEKAAALDGNSSRVLGSLANAYALAGNKTKAEEILKIILDRSRQGFSVNFQAAFIYCGLGDKERAFKSLERAYREGEIEIRYLKVDPAWQSLHSDPRFKGLLKKMNLE